MKKVIIGVLLFCVCSMNAQSVHMVEEDPFWSYCFFSYFLCEQPDPPLPTTLAESFYWFALGETEVINGKLIINFIGVSHLPRTVELQIFTVMAIAL
jgi:hypothetical protein